MSKPLDESTPVRVGLVIAIIGATVWITNIYALGLQNAEAIVHLRDRTLELFQDVSEIKGDVKAIRAILEREESAN